MVKWTTLDPCLVFSESDSILCINMEFYKEKIISILKTYLSTKVNQFIMTKKSKRSLHIIEDVASCVQVGDVEHVIV